MAAKMMKPDAMMAEMATTDGNIKQNDTRCDDAE
jgi:hypothetical protein